MILRVRQAEPVDDVEDFRLERIELLRGNQQPLKLRDSAKFVLHMVPHNAFRRASFEGRIFDVNKDGLKPMAVGGWSYKVNFDGIASVTSLGGESDAYVQLFHNGTFESVNASYFHQSDEKIYIPITGWEDQLIDRIPNYLNMQRALGVDLPVYVMVSLIGVGGYQFVLNDYYARSEGDKIDREELILPPLEITAFDCEISEVMLPLFNRLWNAAGRKGSFNYNADGSRKRR